MNADALRKKIASEGLHLPRIVAGNTVEGIVRKKIDNGVLVDCADGLFTAVILQKEVKDLERNGVDLSPGAIIEAEIIDTSIRHKHGYYIISISKLLQVDVWNTIVDKAAKNEILKVVPTEANL